MTISVVNHEGAFTGARKSSRIYLAPIFSGDGALWNRKGRDAR
jgi:hypothetical protein